MRLDNREEICATLGIPSPSPSFSDAQLVLQAFAAWGADCAARLLGDFAFAIHEPATGRTFCARDAAGVRPLYYSRTSADLVAGLDIDAVLERPGVSHELDESYVAGYLLNRVFSHPEATFFRSVRKLPPGHTLICAGGSITSSRYWPPDTLRPLTFSNGNEAAEALRALLVQAVRARTRVDGPIGVHLSGGLDSSTIAAIAAEEARAHGSALPDALSWQPAPTPAAASSLEHRSIDLVSRRGSLRVHYVPPRLEPLIALLAGDGARRPASATLSNEYQVQLAAEEHGIRHILSGWGGDEIVSSAGKGHPAALVRAGLWRALYAEMRARPVSAWPSFAREALGPHLAPGLQPQARQRRRNGRNSLISSGFLRGVVPLELPTLPTVGAAARMLGSLSHHVTERIESWAVHGARHGVTYSYPLLDRRILEFALTVPPAYFHHGGRSRWLMRQAAAPFLPPEVCWADKVPDTVRMDPLRSLQPKLWGVFRQRLEARTAPPPRSEYVDMPRLMTLLSASERDSEHAMARPWRAVSLLDFQEDER